MRKLSFEIMFLITLVGCSGSGGGGGGAGGGGGSGGIGGGDNEASTGLVAQCQKQAQHFASLCAGDDVRPCTWNAYAKLCQTGETQLLVDSMNCLDQTTCRTFSDANGGVACLGKTHASEESSASSDYITSTCTACKQSNCSASVGIAEIFPYLTDADIAALATCQKNGCSITTLVENCAATIPDVALFLACVK